MDKGDSAGLNYAPKGGRRNAGTRCCDRNSVLRGPGDYHSYNQLSDSFDANLRSLLSACRGSLGGEGEPTPNVR